MNVHIHPSFEGKPACFSHVLIFRGFRRWEKQAGLPSKEGWI
jgi:hypothetical protein